MIRKNHIIVLILLLLVACNKPPIKKEPIQNPKSVFNKVLETKELNVAIINNSVSYFIYKGTPMGFHYELIKEYAKQIGVNLNLHPCPDYISAFKMLESATCQILASNVSITGTRKKRMLFTTPLMRSNPVLVQNKESSHQYVEDWLDVDSLRIAIATQSSNQRIAHTIEETLGLCMNITFYSGVDQEQLIDWVAEGSIPATLADKIFAKVAHTYYPQLDINIDAGLPQNIAWAINLKAKDLRQNLNTWLSGFKKTIQYQLLYVKYFRNKKSILRNKEGCTLSSKRLSTYDTYIKEQASILGWDWRLLAALIYTESRFDISQVSWAGAFGLMQLMPVTAKRFDVSQNSSAKEQIIAGRKYLQYLEQEFAPTMVDTRDLKLFVLAAYNSGPGHIFDAQNLAEKNGKDRDSWKEVAPYLLLLSRPQYYNDKLVKYGYFRGKETVNHVARISDLYRNYKGLLAKK